MPAVKLLSEASGQYTIPVSAKILSEASGQYTNLLTVKVLEEVTGLARCTENPLKSDDLFTFADL